MAGVQNQNVAESDKPNSSSTLDKINLTLEKFEISEDKNTPKKGKGNGKKLFSGNPSKTKEKTFSKSSPHSSSAKASHEKLNQQQLYAAGRSNRLSSSDPSGEALYLKRSTSGDPIRVPKNSSSSSQSSETARTTGAYKRGRRNSDSCPEKGHLVHCALRVQHAAHKCSWSGSESTSASPAFSSNNLSADSVNLLKGASGGPLSSSSSHAKNRPGSKTSSSSSRKAGSRSSKQELKFESYMPLCEVQQGLKKGELIEGVLRINPRNYEDAYISAPDGQMDIYIGGIHDRNRALNGDVVVVQLKPCKQWKVLPDAFRNLQRSEEKFIEPSASAVDISDPANDTTIEEPLNVESTTSDPWGDVTGERPPDTLEILGLEKLTEQFKEFCKEAKSKKNKKRKKRGKVLEPSLPVNSLPEPTELITLNSSENFEATRKNTKEPCPLLHPVKVIPPVAVDCEYIASVSTTTNSENTEVKTEETDHPLCDHKIVLSDSHILEKNCKQTQPESKSSNSWTTGVGSYSENLIISPEDLLTFEDNGPICLIQSFSDDVGDTNSDRDKNYSTDEGGIIVAPDDLSEDEFSDSLSAESICSQNLDQLLEDAAFYASQQDAKNNNIDISNVDNEFDFTNTVENNWEEINSDTESCPTDKVIVNSAGVDCKGNEVQECHPELNSNFSPPLSSTSLHIPLSYSSCVPPNVHSVEKDTFLSTPNAIICKDYSVLEIYNSNSEKSLYDNCTFEKINTEQSNLVRDEEHEISIANTYECIPQVVSMQKPKKKRRSKKKKNRLPADVVSNFHNSKLSHTDICTLPVEHIMNHSQWEKFVKKTGKVVYILEKKHSRVAAGLIKLAKDGNKNMALFSPCDHRLPRIMVPLLTCPQGFYERPTDFAQTLFIARITEWEQNSVFPRGEVIKSLGSKGEIEPETEGILLENDVNFSSFPENIVSSLPLEGWKPSPEEIGSRRDFRSSCVFTIDPSTAHDLDDALSCKVLDNGALEVGVHIADVTYFLKENMPLDIIAMERATSVYMVQRVIPMLPHVLCNKLCSLNPGEDRLTFSVVWQLSPEGKILDEWIGRSVICSCMKLSYEHCQDMIENPTKDWSESCFPPLYGDFRLSDVVNSVVHLHQLAVELRDQRFRNGTLRLDQIKLQFVLDSETGLPSGFSMYEQKDSHRLVEEFMLLANQSVAHKIHKAFPDKAFLRCHPPPNKKMMEDLAVFCASLGVHLDIVNSGALQESLARYSGSDEYSKAKTLVLMSMCSKPMKCALYYCSSFCNEKGRHHYALSVPLYTHFTSPIRRYPDVVVHRLLAASLDYSAPPSLTCEEMRKLANHCNDKKLASKRVQELSADLFLTVFVKECGPVEEKAMVMGIMDHAFDVLILRMGVTKRIYCDKLPAKHKFNNERSPQLTLFWKSPEGEQEVLITIFTMVDVIIEAVPNEPLMLSVIMKKPNEDLMVL